MGVAPENSHLDRASRGPSDFVGALLQPGERIVSILPDAYGGRWPKLVVLILPTIVLAQAPNYSLVATDRRLMLLGRSKVTGRPTAVMMEIPRTGLRVTEYNRGMLWSVLTLVSPGMPELTLNVRRAARKYADDLVRALDPARLP